MGQGRENTRQFLRENPKITELLREKILKLKSIGWTASDPDDAVGVDDPDEGT